MELSFLDLLAITLGTFFGVLLSVIIGRVFNL